MTAWHAGSSLVPSFSGLCPRSFSPRAPASLHTRVLYFHRCHSSLHPKTFKSYILWRKPHGRRDPDKPWLSAMLVWTVSSLLFSHWVCREYTPFPSYCVFPVILHSPPHQITLFWSLLDSKVSGDKARSYLPFCPRCNSRGEATPWMLRTVLIN